MSEWAPPATPAGQPVPKQHPKWHTWFVGIVAVIFVGGLIAANKSKDNDEPDDEGTTELCQLIREDDTLTIGDLRDLSGFTQGELVDYVQRRCPSLLPQVDGNL